MREFDAIVVGGGHNGLACAALLAKRGLSVAVFERRDVLGGAAVSETGVWPGYILSTASYVCSLLDPWIVQTLDLGAHGYSAYRKHPSSFTPLEDGRSLLLGSDDAANEREIAVFDAADVPGFHAFEAESARLGSALFEAFSDEYPSWARFDADTRATLEGSAAHLVERYVRTPVLQATLATDGLIGTYAGPRDDGTGYVLAHHYAGRALGTQGAWGFVRGGMGAISQALASAARAHGAHIFSGADVIEVLMRGDRAIGVALADGRELFARTVISNAHPQITFSRLIGDDYLRDQVPGGDALVAKLRSWKTVGPSLKLNLALGELPDFTARPGLHLQPHHRATIHVAPSLDFLQQACDDARREGESREPMLECFVQTPTDPSLAPSGKHILSIFAQYFPYDRSGGWSETARERAAERVIGMLARFAPNLPNVIEARQVLAAPDLESRFGLIGGNIFHGELLPGQIFDGRFATRTPVRGLYLCGSGAHPGGCVSGFPGRRAADAVARDLVGAR